MLRWILLRKVAVTIPLGHSLSQVEEPSYSFGWDGVLSSGTQTLWKHCGSCLDSEVYSFVPKVTLFKTSFRTRYKPNYCTSSGCSQVCAGAACCWKTNAFGLSKFFISCFKVASGRSKVDLCIPNGKVYRVLQQNLGFSIAFNTSQWDVVRPLYYASCNYPASISSY